MNEWMNEWNEMKWNEMNEWNEMKWMNEWDEWDEWMSKWVNQSINGSIDRWMNWLIACLIDWIIQHWSVIAHPYAIPRVWQTLWIN